MAVSVFDSEHDTYTHVVWATWLPHTHTHRHTHTRTACHINYKSFVAKVSIYSHLSCSRRNHFVFSPSAATLSNHQQQRTNTPIHTHTHTYIIPATYITGISLLLFWGAKTKQQQNWNKKENEKTRNVKSFVPLTAGGIARSAGSATAAETV